MRKILTVVAFLSWGFICNRMGYYSAWEEHQEWDNPAVPDDPITPEPIVEGR